MYSGVCREAPSFSRFCYTHNPEFTSFQSRLCYFAQHLFVIFEYFLQIDQCGAISIYLLNIVYKLALRVSEHNEVQPASFKDKYLYIRELTDKMPNWG